MNNFRDIVPKEEPLPGIKADFKLHVKGRRHEYTDWKRFNNKFGDGVMLQFMLDGVQYVYITHSECILKDLEKYEKRAGKEPFTAVVDERQTSKGNTAIVFI